VKVVVEALATTAGGWRGATAVRLCTAPMGATRFTRLLVYFVRQAEDYYLLFFFFCDGGIVIVCVSCLQTGHDGLSTFVSHFKTHLLWNSWPQSRADEAEEARGWRQMMQGGAS